MLAQLSISIETNNDGFLGQPKRNKEHCNLDCQNAKKKAENEAKAAAVRQAPQTQQRQATVRQATVRQATVRQAQQTQQIPPPTTSVIKTPAQQQTATTPVITTPQTQQTQ